MSTSASAHTTRLWLIRHGEPTPEIRGRCYGRLDVGLSSEGRRQIEDVANHLRSEPLCKIYASPRRRALESAEILGSVRSCGVLIEPDLQEIDFGEFEGLTYDEIAQRYPELYTKWMESPTEVEFPDGESFSNLRSRVNRSIANIVQRHAGESVAAVTHGGVIRVVLAEALAIPSRNLFRIGQQYAAINLVQFVGDCPVVETINGRTGCGGRT